jgi:hypothetical protein
MIVTELNKRNLLKVKDYKYGIGFEVQGCTEHFIGAYRFKNIEERNLLDKEQDGASVSLTCLVFEKYYSYGMPFFVIKDFKIIKK